MNVLLLSPGFPAEMPLFTQGLANVGATVLGVGDQPLSAVPEIASRALGSYLQVRNLWRDDSAIEQIHHWVRGRSIDRIECLWEPGMILAAQLREAMGVPGMTVEQTLPFRDKETMKQVLDRAGVRTPRHDRANTSDQVRDAAERIGYPLIIKPIAGAGSQDTHQLREPAELEPVLQAVRHVAEVSVEEYIEGDELTFDTVCGGGEILFFSLSQYEPKPLLMTQPWVSPISLVFRDVDADNLRAGRALGEKVIDVLGFENGFTHMEWFRTPSGEAVFGEIAARPPGARLVHSINYATDLDLFTGWAEAVCRGRLSQPVQRPFNAAMVFKRAHGEGRIRGYEGLEALLAQFGEHLVNIELSPIGTPKRDHRKIVVGDGWIVARHPDLDTTIEMAMQIATDLRIHAG